MFVCAYLWLPLDIHQNCQDLNISDQQPRSITFNWKKHVRFSYKKYIYVPSNYLQDPPWFFKILQPEQENHVFFPRFNKENDEVKSSPKPMRNQIRKFTDQFHLTDENHQPCLAGIYALYKEKYAKDPRWFFQNVQHFGGSYR